MPTAPFSPSQGVGLRKLLLLRLGFLGALLGDDPVFNPVVSGLWYDVLRDQVIFPAVGSAVNDLLRVCVPNARQGL